MAARQRIGVFGGTFDPIHRAHLDVARAAREFAKLDRVLFVVSARPPHKRDDTVATPEDRYAMVEAAVMDEPQFEASDIELHREGPSYTLETLKELHAENPEADLYLIIGGDSFAEFPGWRAPREILDHAHLLVIPRPGDGKPPPDWMKGKYDFLPFEPVDVSSTEIRERLASGESRPEELPERVARLIEAHCVYNGAARFSAPRADEFVALIRSRLPDKTYRHSISVARTMLEAHEKAGIEAEQAITAGLLHDMCKAMKPDDLRRKAKHYNLTEYLDQPNLLHGPVAAEECRHDLGIDDPDVIDAIRWHTTGRANWCRVGETLFYADFSEPRRPQPQAVEARRICVEQGFEAALRYVVEQKFNYVKKRFKPDPHAQEFEAWVARTYSA